MFPRQPFATNAIYHSVTEPHHVMLLQAIYSCVKDGMTFDQCVWPCFTLLPTHLILNVSYEPFSLWGDKGEAHPRRTFSVRQIAFAPEPFGFKRWYCSCYGCTYGLMADGAKSLQVIQSALSSPTVHRLDVVDLPEITFNGSPDHLVQLQKHGEKNLWASKYPLRFLSYCTAKKKKKTRNCSRVLSYINISSFPSSGSTDTVQPSNLLKLHMYTPLPVKY